MQAIFLLFSATSERDRPRKGPGLEPEVHRGRKEKLEYLSYACGHTLTDLLTAALFATTVLGLAGSDSSLAADSVHTTSIGGLTLPEYIGPLEFIGEHSGPEGMNSLSYWYRAVGLSLQISVTDLGADGVADGIDAPELLGTAAERRDRNRGDYTDGYCRQQRRRNR